MFYFVLGMMSTYLWQNFLKDSKYIKWAVDKIFDLVKRFKLSKVVEIWPGKGAITEHLAWNFALVLFEKDPSFLPLYIKWWGLKLLGKKWDFEIWQNSDFSQNAQALAGDVKNLSNQAFENSMGNKPIVKLYLWDFLKARKDIDDLNNSLFFGNVPYYITSPILIKVAMEFKPQAGLFMVQKEVGEKVDTNASKKSYLWWILNYFYEVKCVKNVPAKAFSPPPKVDSCWILLIKKNTYPQISLPWLQKFLDLIVSKRQTIKKNLGRAGIKLDSSLGSKRLEELTWKDMETLYKQLKNEI